MKRHRNCQGHVILDPNRRSECDLMVRTTVELHTFYFPLLESGVLCNRKLKIDQLRSSWPRPGFGAFTKTPRILCKVGKLTLKKKKRKKSTTNASLVNPVLN